jgi:hypothetical protein
MAIEPPPPTSQSQGAEESSPSSRQELLIAALSLLATVSLGIAGFGQIHWGWLAALMCALGLVTDLTIRAIRTRNLAIRSQLLGAGLLVALLLAAGIFAYTRFWDPAKQHRTFPFVINGPGEAYGVTPSGEPGGPPLVLVGDLWATHTYEFACSTTVDGAEWLRLAQFNRWVPRAAVHPPAGIKEPKLPPC